MHTPILIISGFDDIERRVEILRHGANDYVVKPVIQEEIIVRSQNLMSQKKLLDRVKEQKARLEEMAMTDQLTRLYNRHFLSELAPKRLAEVQRHGAPLSLVVLDLDHFKQINDTHGHEMGDTVLREVAEILKQSCRKEDMAVRLGGEEFLLLLPYCDGDGAKQKAETLRSSLTSARPGGLKVTASFGVTCFTQGMKVNFSDLFDTADKALYEAKHSGRNCVIYRAVETEPSAPESE